MGLSFHQQIYAALSAVDDRERLLNWLDEQLCDRFDNGVTFRQIAEAVLELLPQYTSK